MKRILLSTGLIIALLFYSCGKKETPTPTPPTPPKPVPLAITDFNPKSAMAGESVMITGTSFGTDSNAVAIKFGGSVAVKPKAITDTKLTVTVPRDAQTGNIDVSANGKTVTSSSVFTLTKAPAPVVTVTGFSPSTAKVGETVTITGTAFGTDTNFVSVSFGGTVAVKPKTATPTQLTVLIPKEAKTGKITVVVNGGLPIVSSNTFTVQINPVIISDFSPKTFTEQDTVVIKGSGFGSVSNNVYVLLHSGGVFIKPFKVSPTEIWIIIPYDGSVGYAFSDHLTVHVTGFDDAVSSQSFTYTPIVSITSISKTSARPGELLKLGFKVSHVDFGINVYDENAVTIFFPGAAGIKPSGHSRGIIYARVPNDAKSGSIRGGYTGYATGTSSFSFKTLPKIPPPQKGIWNARPDFETTSTYGASAFVVNGKAYIVGGAEGGAFGGPDKQLWEYDPTYDAWTRKADFPGGGRVYGVAFSIGNKGYYGTGSNYANELQKDFWEYDPSNDVWTRKADFEGTPRVAAVSFAIGSNGYVGSGYDDTKNDTKDFYKYDPSNNQWISIASIPTIRNGAMSFAINDKGYVGNGSYKDALNTVKRRSDLYSYDPSTNSWSVKTAMPNAIVTVDNIAFVIGAKAYVGLGIDVTTVPTAYSKKIYQYDPATDTWTASIDFAGDGRNNAVGFAINNVGYVGGGNSPYFLAVYKDMWSFIP